MGQQVAQWKDGAIVLHAQVKKVDEQYTSMFCKLQDVHMRWQVTEAALHELQQENMQLRQSLVSPIKLERHCLSKFQPWLPV